MDLRAEVERWLAEDPDETTRAELRELLARDDREQLRARFGLRLEFGTAGIRGPLGAGPARMNRVVVRRVTAGLAVRMLLSGGAAERGVVVAHDARHMSAEFAADTARVLAAAGIRVHRMDGLTPTPLLAFAVRHANAAAGVQITASHNPPADNGYKVYWDDGAQIVSPLDAEISAAIDAVEDVALADEDDPLIAQVDPDVTAQYVRACLELMRAPDRRDVRIVYTPLHGVAGDLATHLLAEAGFTDVQVVAEQAEPDPDFPTVAFPNPEIPGALDLAIALARDTRADLVIANDPDGDRVAAAVPDGVGGWRMLDGDELGCLLAEWLLVNTQDDPPRAVATTVVSSQLLARIAEHHGVAYRETLTGFKWLAHAALELADEGVTMVLAYEQALGVMCGTTVLDKDGLSAMLVACEMAAVYRSRGISLLEALDDLARRHGVHATEGRSLRLEANPGLVREVLDRLLSDPPTSVAGIDVVAVADHAAGVRRFTDGSTEPLGTPPTDLVGVMLADGSRLQVRPSGTEPLLKFYFEVVEPVGDGEVTVARTRAQDRLSRLGDAFVKIAGG